MVELALSRARIAPHRLWWCAVALMLAFAPISAEAQQAAFVQALTDLSVAINGTYGDEGAHVPAAIDRMAAALSRWDQEIEAAATQARQSASAALVEVRLSLARMMAARGRLSDALAELDAVARLDPRRPDALILRGLILRSSGKAGEALEAFRTARSIEPSNPVLAYYLFHHASLSGNTREAREAGHALAAIYPTLLKDPPKRSEPFTRIALLHSAAGGPPLIPLAAYEGAFRRVARHEYEDAIAEFRRAAASDPLVSAAATRSEPAGRAIAALRQGRIGEALTLLAQSTATGDASELHRLRGLVYWSASEDEKSIAELSESIRRSPRNERARLALSRVLSRAGSDADAVRSLQDTLQVLPESALAHWWLSSTYETLNRFADARQEATQAAAAAVAGESQLYGSIGRLATGAADFAGAIDAYAHAVDVNPNDVVLHKLLAGALMRQDRPDEALAEFVAVLLIDPRDGDALVGIGQVHLSAGRAAEAADTFRRATDMSPGNSEARYALASALAQLGRTDEATQHFARVEQEQQRALADRRRALSHDVLKEEAALRASEGKFDTAITLYERALAVSSDPAVYGRLADLYAKTGRAPDAARARALYEQTRPNSSADGGAR
jgi:tetratricopeptide (TPR) repeat protein